MRSLVISSKFLCNAAVICFSLFVYSLGSNDRSDLFSNELQQEQAGRTPMQLLWLFELLLASNKAGSAAPRRPLS